MRVTIDLWGRSKPTALTASFVVMLTAEEGGMQVVPGQVKAEALVQASSAQGCCLQGPGEEGTGCQGGSCWQGSSAGPRAASFQEHNSIPSKRGKHNIFGLWEKGWGGGRDNTLLVPGATCKAKENGRWRGRTTPALHPGLSPCCGRLRGVGWGATPC